MESDFSTNFWQCDKYVLVEKKNCKNRSKFILFEKYISVHDIKMPMVICNGGWGDSVHTMPFTSPPKYRHWHKDYTIKCNVMQANLNLIFSSLFLQPVYIIPQLETEHNSPIHFISSFYVNLFQNVNCHSREIEQCVYVHDVSTQWLWLTFFFKWNFEWINICSHYLIFWFPSTKNPLATEVLYQLWKFLVMSYKHPQGFKTKHMTSSSYLNKSTCDKKWPSTFLKQCIIAKTCPSIFNSTFHTTLKTPWIPTQNQTNKAKPNQTKQKQKQNLWNDDKTLGICDNLIILCRCLFAVVAWLLSTLATLLSQCGSTQTCLSRSIPEIHYHVAGTLSKQQMTATCKKASQGWICFGHFTCCHTWKLHLKLAFSPTHSLLTHSQPGLPLTLQCPTSGMVTTRAPSFQSLLRPHRGQQGGILHVLFMTQCRGFKPPLSLW